MLQKIRSKAQSFGAKIVALIICFVLVVFGFGAFNLFTASEPVAAVVNGEKIYLYELNTTLQNEWNVARESYGPELTPELIGSVEYWLNQLIDHKLLVQQGQKVGIHSSRDEYLAQLQSQSGLQTEDGNLDTDLLRRVLAQSGFTLSGYEEMMRKQAVVDQVWSLTWDSSFTTEREVKETAQVARQSRDIAYLLFVAPEFVENLNISDERVEEYYQMNSADYMTEEEFELSYVVLTKAQFTEGLEVHEEDIRALHAERSADSVLNAERRGRHILIKTDDETTEEDATAQILELKEQIENGASFVDLASEFSEDEGSAIFGGDLGFRGRGIFVPPFEEALYALEVGELSAPVVSEFGVHLIELMEIQEVDYPSLEDAHDDLQQELLEELATPIYDEQLALLEQLAFENVDTLEPIAEQFGLDILVQPGITRDWGPGPLSKSIVRQQVLVPDVVENGFNSLPIEIDERSHLVARLISRTEPTLEPLEYVRPAIELEIHREEGARLARKNRDEAYELLLQETDYSEVAERYGLNWITVDRMGRFDNTVPDDIRSQAFSVQLASSGERELRSARGTDRDQAIVLISAVYEGDFSALTQIDQSAIRNNTDFDIKNLDVRCMQKALRDRSNINIKVPAHAIWNPGSGVILNPSTS